MVASINQMAHHEEIIRVKYDSDVGISNDQLLLQVVTEASQVHTAGYNARPLAIILEQN